jgi:hypothetical protein
LVRPGSRWLGHLINLIGYVATAIGFIYGMRG